MSQRLDIPRTTMHYALRKLEKRGWIERSQGQRRADQPIFSLTSDGRKQMAAVIKAFFLSANVSCTYVYMALYYEGLVAVAMDVRGI